PPPPRARASRRPPRYPPDVNKDPGAEERFKEVNEAYHVLADPGTRARYDRFGPDFRRIPEGAERAWAGAGSRGPGGRPPGGAGRDRTFDEEQVFVSGEGLDDIDLEDLFGGLFGGRRASGPMAGADQEAELELTVEEAYRGGRRWVSLAGPDGQRSYEVTIPAGVVDGQRIRLTGQGGRGTGGGGGGGLYLAGRGPGDLYLVVRIAPPPRFRLDGRDLHVDLPVSPWEAALGSTVPVDTPGGEAKVKVPAGSSSGRRLRLRGQGMPNPSGQPGDLYAEVRIMVPRSPGRRERELFEELAKVSDFNPRRTR